MQVMIGVHGYGRVLGLAWTEGQTRIRSPDQTIKPLVKDLVLVMAVLEPDHVQIAGAIRGNTPGVRSARV